MSDLWQWFSEREWAYAAEGDKDRLKMARMCNQAFDFSETDPHAMVAMNRKGRDLAKRLNEPWWTFLYDVWIGIGLETHVGDLQAALQQCLHCVNEARKPVLKGHPWIVAAYNTLLACYVRIDPVGYAPAIRKSVRHLNKEIPRGPGEHRYVMMIHERDFLMALGQLKRAETQALRHIALFDQEPWGSEWYLLYALIDLCWIGYHQQDWQKVNSYAEIAEEVALRLENTQLDAVEAQMWLAMAARKAGDEKAARRKFRAAQSRLVRIEKTPSPELHDALAYFHELGENLDKALEVRDNQIAALTGKSRLHAECNAHILRCELLTRLGRLTTKDIVRAREAAAALKQARTYLARIKRLENFTK